MTFAALTLDPALANKLLAGLRVVIGALVGVWIGDVVCAAVLDGVDGDGVGVGVGSGAEV